jgi:hypothetical protein
LASKLDGSAEVEYGEVGGDVLKGFNAKATE